MGSAKLEFRGDELYEYIPLPQYGNSIYETHLVMTKEVFQECYRKWILNEEIKYEDNCDE